MRVELVHPSPAIGETYEKIAYMAARRARTVKDHDALRREALEEVTTERRRRFLRAVIQEEWSLDVAEMSLFVYDIEGVPSWLMTELLRHRLIAREWSLEQRSKRAIHGHRLPVVNPWEEGTPLHADMAALIRQSQELMARAAAEGHPAERIRYAALEGTETAFMAAGNARAMHHLFTLRGSPAIGGDGKAAPVFQEVTDRMFALAQEACPGLFQALLRS